MVFITMSYPVILLSLACLGYGICGMALLWKERRRLPIAFRLVAAYFLGQSLLAGFFVVLALCGVLTSAAVLGTVIPGAMLAAIGLWYSRYELGVAGVEAWKAWNRAPLAWRGISFLAAFLYAYGASSMGRSLLEVDATAFYLAAAKLIAHTGHLDVLPGYESFSWVIMTGELLYSSLMLLGSPGASARLYEWVNFFPAILAMYWVARIAKLTVRAGVLAAVMLLTSSAALALWGSGKTDTFAIGPALIGVCFALLSWRSVHRINSIALSGLFCGFAAAAKFPYIIPLLPGFMLLIFWNSLGAGFREITVRAWKPLSLRMGRTVLATCLFLGFVVLGLCPFLVKNLIIFRAPIGSGASLAESKWYSDQTIFRLIVSYPIALTYGRYWAQAGTLSPLVLAFIPLFFLMPRTERKISSPLAAITISTIVATAIWMALMPSIFMPRYFLATLMLFAIPAAAAAAYASRKRTILSITVVTATVVALLYTPFHVATRSKGIFAPGAAIEYFRTGDEERLFTFDQTVSAFYAVNRVAEPGDRVLSLIYPRLWLRADLLAAMSKSAEMADATNLLAKRSPEFWTFVEERKFKFLVVDLTQIENVAAAARAKRPEPGFCQIKETKSFYVFGIGKACTKNASSLSDAPPS